MGLMISKLIVDAQNHDCSQSQMRPQQVVDPSQTPSTLSDPLPAGAQPDYKVRASTLRPSRSLRGINTPEQYFKYRQARGRSLSPLSKELVIRGTKSMESVRNVITMRGNNRPDIARTDGEAARRWQVTRIPVQDILRELAEDHPAFRCIDRLGLRHLSVPAASATITGAGNCGEFTSATLIEAGMQLKENEQVVEMGNYSADHYFVHLESIQEDGTKRVVVLDSWANGPAVMQEDYAFQQKHKVSAFSLPISNPEVAKEAKRQVELLVDAHNQNPEYLNQLKRRLEYLHSINYAVSENKLYDDQYVVNQQGSGSWSQG